MVYVTVAPSIRTTCSFSASDSTFDSTVSRLGRIFTRFAPAMPTAVHGP